MIGKQGSNKLLYQLSYLPYTHERTGRAGFEPATSCLKGIEGSFLIAYQFLWLSKRTNVYRLLLYQLSYGSDTGEIRTPDPQFGMFRRKLVHSLTNFVFNSYYIFGNYVNIWVHYQ